MSVDGIGGSPLHCSDGKQDKMVKKVIDYKLLNGKRYYKVKWECTWELEDSLLSCQGLVDQFWGFVNRVKSEDNRIPVHKKSRLNESIICIKSDKSEKSNCSEDVISSVQISRPDALQDSQKQKSENFHSNDDLIRKTVNIKPIGKGENMVDENNIPNLPSMVTINPPRQALQIPCAKDGIGTPGLPQHPSSVFKRSYGIMDGNAEENFNQSSEIIDLKMQRHQLNGNGEERRFQCHVCGMAFKRKDMCKRHLRTHTNDCCYFCSICKKGFIRRYVLVKHLNKDHQTNDQTKILSTKRRRRDDMKQEQISNLPMPSKNDTHGMVSMSADTSESEYVLDPADNLSIDDEHDYDKKTDNVVVVFKMESDNSKMESTIRTCEYSEKHLGAGGNADLPVDHVEDTPIKTAVIAPLNSLPEHNVGVQIPSHNHEHNVGVNIASHNHEYDKSLGTYVMVSRNNVSLPENIHNTDVVPYNTQYTFSAKEANQSCSQQE